MTHEQNDQPRRREEAAPGTSTNHLEEFDRLLAEYEGVPSATKTKPTITRAIPYMPTKPVETWVVSMLRAELRDGVPGEYLFLERTSPPLRLVIPPAVVASIIRHRDQVISKARKRAARARLEASGPPDVSHLHDPKVRARALAARKAKAAKRRARRRR